MSKSVMIAVVSCCCVAVHANVMMDTVPVGNPGNIGEASGGSIYAPVRTCGAVDYAYEMGKYEVTAGQYTEFLNAVAGMDTYGLYDRHMWSDSTGGAIERHGSSPNYTYSVAADWARRPVSYVSWADAARFANWMHNGQPAGGQDSTTTENGAYNLQASHAYYEPDGSTPGYGQPGFDEITAILINVTREEDATWVIPSEDEWYKAAYYSSETSGYFDYPTSSNTAPGYVTVDGNLSGTDTPFAEGGTDPGNYATYDKDDATTGIGFPYYETEVGEWENSASPYGTFDQGGNLFEWTEAVLEGSYRSARGGSTAVDVDALHASCRNYYRFPTHSNQHFGFRLAYIPEPTTILLLALGGLALVGRR